MYSPSQRSPIKTETASQGTKLHQYLRFHLEPKTDLILPVTQIIEVLTVPTGKIVPIPHMPTQVMGVYNWRGEILWMVDLGRLFGLTSWQEQTIASGLKAIVLSPNAASKIKGEMLGLVVNRVEDIELCNKDEIQSPPSSALSPEMAPFVAGYWLNSRDEMLVTLDGEAIMAAMPKA